MMKMQMKMKMNMTMRVKAKTKTNMQAVIGAGIEIVSEPGTCTEPASQRDIEPERYMQRQDPGRDSDRDTDSCMGINKCGGRHRDRRACQNPSAIIDTYGCCNRAGLQGRCPKSSASSYTVIVSRVQVHMVPCPCPSGRPDKSECFDRSGLQGHRTRGMGLSQRSRTKQGINQII